MKYAAAVSHDGLFAVREDGRDSYYYDRWAALQIDRLLLTGPTAALDFVRGLQRTESPVMWSFMCGAVWIDLDARELLYWERSFFGGTAPMRRFHGLMLARRWAGWRTRWAMRGALDFADVLRAEPEEVESSGRRQLDWLQSEAAAGQIFADDARVWSDWCAGYEKPGDLESEIAEHGEEMVRAWAFHDANTLISLRGADGSLADHYLDAGKLESPVCMGPQLIERLRGRRPLGDLSCLREDRIHHTVMIDEGARTIWWSMAQPSWLPVERWAGGIWPGWTLEQHDGGARRHIELSGRDSAPIRLTVDDAIASLHRVVARCLAGQFDPLGMLAQEAERLLSEAGPGATVRTETAATDGREVGAVRDEALAAAMAEWSRLVEENP